MRAAPGGPPRRSRRGPGRGAAARAAGAVLAGALTVGALAACESHEPARGPARDCSFVAFYQADAPVRQVALVADFNGWDPDATPLAPQDGAGLYAVIVTPPAGLHAYRILADGVPALDPYNPLTLLGDDGDEVSAMRIPDCATPGLAVTSFNAAADGTLAATLQFQRGRARPDLDATSLAATLDGAPVTLTAQPATGAIGVAASGLAAGKHRLTVGARDQGGAAVEPLAIPFWTEATPFDWRDAVIYQIVVDRFAKGGGALDDSGGPGAYHGGDLAGVTAAVESGYFDRLGVNALWVSPLYLNPEGSFGPAGGVSTEAYHGYWPAAPRTASVRFGGEAGVDALVGAAHARGLRVLMDLVPNHVHQQHPYWTDHEDDGWFNHPTGDCVCGVTCAWATDIVDCWFEPFLPDLRWGTIPVVEQGTGDAVWWLDRFDLDGFRVDAVPMMPRLATRHLRDAVHRALETGGTSVYLVGETYTPEGGQDWIRYYLGPQGLSGQFDYPVLWALRDALAARTSMADLDAEVLRSEAAWAGSGAVMAPILGNHDVARFVSDMNGDGAADAWTAPPAAPAEDKPYALLGLGFTFLLTQAGAPVIYYGDELGMPGAGDPDNRRDMRFDADLAPREAALLAQVQRLGTARRCSTALRRGARVTLVVNDNLYAYGRDTGDGTVAVILLNRATVARDLSLAIPADWSFVDDTALLDVFGAPVTVTGRVIGVTVPPRAAALLLSETACVPE